VEQSYKAAASVAISFKAFVIVPNSLLISINQQINKTMAPVRRRVSSKFELAVDLDYRCPIDDAWYRVRVVKFRDRALRIMYVDFSEAPDEWYGSRQFQSSDELEELLSRFRYPAKQLEDKQCDHVTIGQLVVACQEFYDGSLSFYDACVNSVCSFPLFNKRFLYQSKRLHVDMHVW
jgi:SAWADEE domain